MKHSLWRGLGQPCNVRRTGTVLLYCKIFLVEEKQRLKKWAEGQDVAATKQASTKHDRAATTHGVLG